MVYSKNDVCLSLQRAPSAPSSHVPSRPSRSAVGHTTSVDPSTRPSHGTYAPLTATNREQPAVYQEISVPKSGAKKSVFKQNSTGGTGGTTSNPGSGVYQALGNNKDAPSTYAVCCTSTKYSPINHCSIYSLLCRQSILEARGVGELHEIVRLLIMPCTWVYAQTPASLPRMDLMQSLIVSSTIPASCYIELTSIL